MTSLARTRLAADFDVGRSRSTRCSAVLYGPGVSAWTDPLWLAEAQEWIQAQAARLDLGTVGAIDQHHVRPWSMVMRVPTAGGDVYLKANIAASARGCSGHADRGASA